MPIELNKDFSHFATVGLTMGLSPNLTTVEKALLLLTMMQEGLNHCASIGLYTKQNISSTAIKYPEDKIMVGYIYIMQ